MEQSIIYPIVVFAILFSFIVFVCKFCKAIKNKNKAEIRNLLLTATQKAVSYAEKIVGITGETKKQIAMTLIQQEFIDNNKKFNKDAADKSIENAIDFSKEVNAEPKVTIQNIDKVKLQ